MGSRPTRPGERGAALGPNRSQAAGVRRGTLACLALLLAGTLRAAAAPYSVIVGSVCTALDRPAPCVVVNIRRAVRRPDIGLHQPE